MGKNRFKLSRGFTLLEVMITLAILASMVFMVSQLLQSSFDMRMAISQTDKVTKKSNIILNRLSYDIGHAFLLSTRHDRSRTGGKRRTIFKIEKKGESDVISFTYTAHKPTKAGQKESDLSYVVYEVRPSKKYSNRSNLYRGEFPRVPDRFRELPPMKIFATDVKTIRFDAWNGDDWSRDGWDSSSRDTSNLLPTKVRIVIRLWSEDAIYADNSSDSDDDPVDHYATVAYLPYSIEFKELKEGISSFQVKP